MFFGVNSCFQLPLFGQPQQPGAASGDSRQFPTSLARPLLVYPEMTDPAVVRGLCFSGCSAPPVCAKGWCFRYPGCQSLCARSPFCLRVGYPPHPTLRFYHTRIGNFFYSRSTNEGSSKAFFFAIFEYALYSCNNLSGWMLKPIKFNYIVFSRLRKRIEFLKFTVKNYGEIN